METFLTMLAVGAVVLVLAHLIRRQDHWVSDDGLRFTCEVQEIAHQVEATGTARWRPARAAVDGGRLVVVRLGAGLGGPLDHAVTAEAPDPPRRQAVFLLDSSLALRVPARSRAVTTLRSLLPAQPSA